MVRGDTGVMVKGDIWGVNYTFECDKTNIVIEELKINRVRE